MKSTTRGTLVAVVTGVAAAVGAAATPAAAVEEVPVTVPLKVAEKPLNMEMPELGYELAVPTKEATRADSTGYAVGGLVPGRAVPQPPVSYGLPGAWLRTPLPNVLGEGFDHVGVRVPSSDLRTLAPALVVDLPLTAEDQDAALPQPHTKLPQVGVLA